MNMFIARDECVLCWRWTLLKLETMSFRLEMNTLVLETNALKTCFQTSTTHTELATNNFQTELLFTSPSKTGSIPLWRLWNSTYSQLVASKLVPACNSCSQYSGCGLTICATPVICEVKPQNLMAEITKRLFGQFWGRNSPVVACMQP